MKKLTLIIALLTATLAAHAQFEQGKWILNPSLTGLGISYNRAEKLKVGIEGQVGTFLADNVAALVHLGAHLSESTDFYTAGAGGRYYFDRNGIYLGVGLEFDRYSTSAIWGNNKRTVWGPSAEVGYAFFLSRTVTIEPAVYYKLRVNDMDLSRLGLKVGFGLYF
ncbi:MAG: hypothetical protein SPJ97_06725 [Bacteroides sp.]|nr:hypothetical protein [Bacteroides sp.]